MSIADGDDEDPMGIEKSQLEQAPHSQSLEDHVLHMERGDPGTIHPAAQRHTECEEFQYYHKDIHTTLKTWFIKSGIIGGVRVTMPCIKCAFCNAYAVGFCQYLRGWVLGSVCGLDNSCPDKLGSQSRTADAAPPMSHTLAW